MLLSSMPRSGGGTSEVKTLCLVALLLGDTGWNTGIATRTSRTQPLICISQRRGSRLGLRLTTPRERANLSSAYTVFREFCREIGYGYWTIWKLLGRRKGKCYDLRSVGISIIVLHCCLYLTGQYTCDCEKPRVVHVSHCAVSWPSSHVRLLVR